MLMSVSVEYVWDLLLAYSQGLKENRIIVFIDNHPSHPQIKQTEPRLQQQRAGANNNHLSQQPPRATAQASSVSSPLLSNVSVFRLPVQNARQKKGRVNSAHGQHFFFFFFRENEKQFVCVVKLADMDNTWEHTIYAAMTA